MTLAQLLNQNSFLIGVMVVLGGWFAVLVARRPRARAWLAWVTAAVAAIGVYFAARTVPPRVFASAAEVQQAIASGTPTLVEFYSDL